MNRVRLEFKLRQYWLYIAAFSSPVLVLGLAYLSMETDPSLIIANVPEAKVPVNRIPVASPLKRRNLESDARAPVVARITEYQSAYAEDPGDSDAPAYLMAIGTLQLERLSDYSAALGIFEQVLSDYPDAAQRSTAYYQALACCLRMGDENRARSLLRQMRNEFPDDSEEHGYADDLLSNGIPLSPTSI